MIMLSHAVAGLPCHCDVTVVSGPEYETGVLLSAAMQALGQCVALSGAKDIEKLRMDESIALLQVTPGKEPHGAGVTAEGLAMTGLVTCLTFLSSQLLPLFVLMVGATHEFVSRGASHITLQITNTAMLSVS